LSPEQAASHIGETATVCGVVVSAEYEVNEQNQPTLLDLGKPNPSAIFTTVIYGENRAKFAKELKSRPARLSPHSASAALPAAVRLWSEPGRALVAGGGIARDAGAAAPWR